MIQIIEAIPMYSTKDEEAYLVLVLSNPAWPEMTKQFKYEVNDNATLTLISEI